MKTTVKLFDILNKSTCNLEWKFVYKNRSIENQMAIIHSRAYYKP